MIEVSPEDSPSQVRGTQTYPTARGILAGLAIFAILITTVWWLAKDAGFKQRRVLSEATRLVLSSAVIQPDPQTVVEAATEGMLSTLDPFSSYLPPDEYEWLMEDTEGAYVGIGVEIVVSHAAVLVVHVFPQSPAADALIRPGDRIVRIGETLLGGLSAGEVTRLMRAFEGESVDITLETRAGEQRVVTLQRRQVDVSPFPLVGVTRSKIAYIRWTRFSAGSGDQLAALVEDLTLADPIGMVLDLRGNPGGLLREAVVAAGGFLPTQSDVCQLVDRDGASLATYKTDSMSSVYEGPLVVLMDESSASASEVFAAALRDHGRALLVGRRSFGKGWVQSISPLETLGALRLSTARIVTPNGHSIGHPPHLIAGDTLASWHVGLGLIPDSIVEQPFVGPWERAMAEAGFYAEFVTSQTEGQLLELMDSPTELLDAIKSQCDDESIIPDGPVAKFITYLSDNGADEFSEQGTTFRLALSHLISAGKQEADLIFVMEGDQVIRRVWERALLSIGRPDPAELSHLFDWDADCAIARDLLEQPELFQRLLNTSMHDRDGESMAVRSIN